ncbi:MAG: hypothetical protein ACRCU5_11425, partial [Rhizobiaceae bacterium]
SAHVWAKTGSPNSTGPRKQKIRVQSTWQVPSHFLFASRKELDSTLCKGARFEFGLRVSLDFRSFPILALGRLGRSERHWVATF